jgi:hypothetical protein
MRSPRGRAHPAVRVRRRRLDHRPVQLPRDPASEVLAWMAHALIAATRLGDTPDNASRDEPPPPAQHRNPRPPSGPPHAGRPTASPAGATHTGSPRRQARPAARGSQQGHARHRRRRPQRRHRPHKSSAASSNRYINGRSAYSASTGDRTPEPGNNRRSACSGLRQRAVGSVALRDGPLASRRALDPPD